MHQGAAAALVLALGTAGLSAAAVESIGIPIDLPYSSQSASLGRLDYQGQAAYCIQATVHATEGDKWPAPAAVEEVSDPVLATILGLHENDGDVVTQAAISYLVHQSYERDGSYTGGAETVKAHIDAAAPAEVKARAAELVAEAQRYDGTQPTAGGVTTSDHRSGTVYDVGVQAPGGIWVAGLPYKVIISGDATAKWTGDLKGGYLSDNGRVWNGTSTGGPITLAWEATGNGRVVTTIRLDFTRFTKLNLLTLYSSPLWSSDHQDLLLSAGHGDPETREAPGPVFDTVFDFRVNVSTTAEHRYDEPVRKGSSLFDNLHASAASGDQWVTLAGDPVDLLARVTWYGPFNEPQSQTETVPAGAPVAGTEMVTLTGPGTFKSTGTVKATASGYFTAVASVLKSDQGDNAKYLRSDFIAPFFELAETSVTEFDMDIASDVPTSSESISKGEAADDMVSLAGTTPGDLWLSTAPGAPIRVPMITEVFGPVATEGAEVPSAPVATERWVADRYGNYDLTDIGDTPLENSGYYTIRTSVDTAKLLDEPEWADARKYLDSDFYATTDGLWAPNETVIVRMAPEVVTQVQDRVIDETKPAQDVALIDNVTVSLPDDGDLWLNVDGAPVEVPTVNQAFGPFDVPQAQTDDPTAEEAGKALNAGEKVTFTEAGTQATPGGTVISNAATGFYTWESKIAADPKYFDGFDSPFWVEVETTTVRDLVEHYSYVEDVEVNQGGQVADTIGISQMRENHGTFEGQGEWVADQGDARVVLYGPLDYNPAETEFTEVPEGTPVAGVIDGPAVNDEFQVGKKHSPDSDRYGDLAWAYDHVSDWLTLPKGTPESWYVFVYEFDGDHRVAPYASPFNAPTEYVHVPGPDTPPVPSIDIEKSNDGVLDAGLGLYRDRNDNRNRDGNDADTRLTAVQLDQGEETKLYARVTNNGTEPLVNIEVTDETTIGEKTVEWTCDIPKELAVGDSFVCEATLEGLEHGEVHGNLASVTARGKVSAVNVGDDDPWHGIVPEEPPAVELPEVTTQATPIAKLGDEVRDVLKVTKVVDDDLTAISRAYAQDDDPKTPPVCDAETLVFTSKPFAINGVGEYPTDGFTPEKVGVIHWVETLTDRHGNVVAEGECGLPNETTYVVDAHTLAGHVDTDGDGKLTAGDTYFDQIFIEGALPEGALVAAKSVAWSVPKGSVEFDLVAPAGPNGGVIKTLRDEGWKELGTAHVIDPITEPGRYVTKSLRITEDQFEELGALTWIDEVTVTVTTEDGERHSVTLTGVRGDLEETVGPLTYGGKQTVSEQTGTKEENAITGAETLVLVTLAAGLLAAGAVVVTFRKRALTK